MSDAPLKSPTKPMTSPPTAGDFGVFIDRYHPDLKLRRLHFARLILGVGGASLAVIYNFLRLDPRSAQEAVVEVATIIAGLHVFGCLVTLLVARWRFLADFHRHTEDLRERAWQVAQYIQRRGAVLLVLAATGDALIVIGTHFRLHLFAPDGDVLLLMLIPTALLLVHGLCEIPTRERLLRLYQRLG
jgi:hypothetical protein